MLFGFRRQKLCGQRLRLTNEERERLGIRQIAPCDITKEQLMEHRRAKHRAQELERRQLQGAVSRDQFRQNAEALRAEADALGVTHDDLTSAEAPPNQACRKSVPEAETGCRKSVRDKL